MKKNIKSLTVFILFIILLFCILTNTKTVMESVTFSISIWKDNLFPTLFPFLIISSLFMNYGISIILGESIKPLVNKLGLSSDSGFVIIASMFSGFPSSSKFIKDLLDKNSITKEEAEYLLKFCHFSNPLFVIGTIGILLLNSKELGLLILLCHYLGAFIIAFIFRKKAKMNSKLNLREAYRRMKKKMDNSDSFSIVLKNTIMDSLNVMFLLLGIITVFLILSNILKIMFNFNDSFQMLVSGILEMTQGIKYVSSLNITIEKQALFMLAFISFGGLSIHTQITSILDNYKINYLSYLLSRILHVLISCSLFYFIFNFIY